MNKPTGTPDAPRAVDAGVEAARKFLAKYPTAFLTRNAAKRPHLLASFAAERTAAVERENAALKRERGWVPFTKGDRLPEDGTYLVTVEHAAGNPVTEKTPRWRLVKRGAAFNGSWMNPEITAPLYGEVVAYQPLPKPYDIARAALTDAKGGEGESKTNGR
jgi:hypothetical protein